MQLQIPSELTQFVEGEVASGRFPTQEDVVVAGLRLLKQDREDAIAGIQEGIARWRRGEGASLDESFAKLRAKHGISENA